MKINDIIRESIEFAASELDMSDPKHPRGVYRQPGEYQEVECFACDGTGKEEWGKDEKYECGLCSGKGTRREWVDHSPAFNVSNSNGIAIQKFLGIKPDYVGDIDNKDLPAIMRKLIALKNGDINHLTVDPSTKKGDMRRTKDPETGLTKISRGATIQDMGRSADQVRSYVDRLIKLVKYAQENGLHITWG